MTKWDKERKIYARENEEKSLTHIIQYDDRRGDEDERLLMRGEREPWGYKQEENGRGEFSPQEEQESLDPSSSLLEESLAALSPREAQILRMHFGLGEAQACTLEEIGKDFQVSRERIRQIEARALEKIRRAEISALLRDFFKN